jgi:hypothetical protein
MTNRCLTCRHWAPSKDLTKTSLCGVIGVEDGHWIVLTTDRETYEFEPLLTPAHFGCVYHELETRGLLANPEE